jgi:hypothetical protein
MGRHAYHHHSEMKTKIYFPAPFEPPIAVPDTPPPNKGMRYFQRNHRGCSAYYSDGTLKRNPGLGICTCGANDYNEAFAEGVKMARKQETYRNKMKYVPIMFWVAAFIILIGLWLSQTTAADWNRFMDCDGASPGQECGGF